MTDLNDLHEVLEARRASVADVDPSVTDVLVRAQKWRRTRRILHVAMVVAVIGAGLAAIGLLLAG